MARDTGSLELHALKGTLEQTLLSFYQEEYPLGFKDREVVLPAFQPMRGANPSTPIVEVSKAGILDGVSGVLLASYRRKGSNWVGHPHS